MNFLHKRPLFFSLPAVLIFLSTCGCAAQPTVVKSSIWPATFSARRLLIAKGLVVYAQSESVAETTARHVAELGRDFTRNTGQQPMNGLLIVNDVDDTQIGSLDLEGLMPDDQHEAQLIEMGFTLQEFVLSMGFPIQKERFDHDSAFTAAALQTVQWVVSVPSQRRIDRFADHLIDAGLKKQNFNFFQRMLIMPFLPLIHGLISDAINAERDTAIYSCFCEAQTNWTSDRRKQESQDYAQKRMGAVVKSLKATTQRIRSESDEK